jgi:hypothetical protein
MAETRPRAHGDLGYPGYIKSLCINAGCYRKKEKTSKDQMFCSHFLSSFVKLGTLTIETANYQGKPLPGRKVTHLRRYIRQLFIQTPYLLRNATATNRCHPPIYFLLTIQ